MSTLSDHKNRLAELTRRPEMNNGGVVYNITIKDWLDLYNDGTIQPYVNNRSSPNGYSKKTSERCALHST